MARASRPRRGCSSAWSRATSAACPGPCPATPWTRRRSHDSPRSTVRRRRGRGRACSFEATPRKVGDGWRRRNRGGQLHGSDWKSFSSSSGSRGGSRSGGDPAPRPAARSHLTIVACSAPRASPSVPHDVTTPEASGGGNRAAILLQQGSQEVAVQHDAIALIKNIMYSAKQRGKMEEVFGKNCRNTMR